MEYKIIELNDISFEEMIAFMGVNDNNVNVLEDLYHTSIIVRDNEIKVKMNQNIFEIFKKHLDLIFSMLKDGQNITDESLVSTYHIVTSETKENYNYLLKKVIAYNHANKAIRVKTIGQARLIKSISDNEIVFASGPAGTGKTYLAVVMAINALKNNEVKKIVLTRPAVEAGESLGFLPGDLKEKVDPYLMPLYDALDELLGHEKVETLLERNVIEIIPLAYMRGRTLNDAFIILDEAQNTTSSQMKMFLTRLGMHSKMVITGDITQIDLNIKKASSGFKEASDILKGIKGIDIVELNRNDVVRNPLVQDIIDKYEQL